MSKRNVHFDTLEGKVVVITGAASGIGRALALDAASRGAVLALSDVDAPGLQQTADLIAGRRSSLSRSGLPRAPRIDKLDVRDRAAWKEYAAAVAADLGKVNVIINNAGV